jgi:hypothetical protein
MPCPLERVSGGSVVRPIRALSAFRGRKRKIGRQSLTSVAFRRFLRFSCDHRPDCSPPPAFYVVAIVADAELPAHKRARAGYKALRDGPMR